MKTLSRLVSVTYFILLGGKAAFLLIVGLLMLLFAACLFPACDGYLMIIPIVLGGSGFMWIMQALEPFAGKRPPPAQQKGGTPQRPGPTEPRRTLPARRNY